VKQALDPQGRGRQHLASQGADVLKVEKPGAGDTLRALAPHNSASIGGTSTR
jgi:crotonobetainyl-CoA:carnitine CoA-transferase CaiB-like acyl-CoA transferase